MTQEALVAVMDLVDQLLACIRGAEDLLSHKDVVSKCLEAIDIDNLDRSTRRTFDQDVRKRRHDLQEKLESYQRAADMCESNFKSAKVNFADRY